MIDLLMKLFALGYIPLHVARAIAMNNWQRYFIGCLAVLCIATTIWSFREIEQGRGYLNSPFPDGHPIRYLYWFSIIATGASLFTIRERPWRWLDYFVLSVVGMITLTVVLLTGFMLGGLHG